MPIDISRINAVIKQMKLLEKLDFLGCGLSLKTAHSDKYKIFSLKLPDELIGYKPNLSALGCTFCKELAYDYGQMYRTLAFKNRLSVDGAINIGVVGDPMKEGAEYGLSEDPLVVSELASGFIAGAGWVIATNILGADSGFIDRTIDPRALNEIYLNPLYALNTRLKGVGLPSGTLNGTPISINRDFAKQISDILGDKMPLFNEMASVFNKPKTVSLYSSFEVAQNAHGKADILNKIENGNLDEKYIDRCLEKIINLVANRYENLKEKFDLAAGFNFDENIASKSIVMLKNDGVLPLLAESKIYVSGDISKEQAKNFGELLPQLDSFKVSDTVVVFAKNEKNKLTHKSEKLLKQASDAGKKTILIIMSPRPVETNSILSANAVLYLPNMYFYSFDAIVKILLGELSPSGKLNVSWAFKQSDYPQNLFNKDLDINNNNNAYCYESVYNGYRYFNSFNQDVQFPFGFGLSFTNFKYSNLNVVPQNSFIEIEFTVKNIGAKTSEHVCFAFSSIDNTNIYGLKSRLLFFKRIKLDADENTRVSFKVPYDKLGVFCNEKNEFIIPGGNCKILVGENALSLPLDATFKLPFASRVQAGLDSKEIPAYFNDNKFLPGKKEIELLLKTAPARPAYNFYLQAPQDKKIKSLEKKSKKRILNALGQQTPICLNNFSEFGYLKIIKSDI